MSKVPKQAAVEGERDRSIRNWVRVNSALIISCVIGIKFQPKLLLIASEVVPIVAARINCHVRFDAYKIVGRCCAIERKHFRYNCVHLVRGVIANNDVLWIKELPDGELTVLTGQDVGGFNSSGPVACPFNMNLNGKTTCVFTNA